MSQSVMESLFGGDPFFEPTLLLWPRPCAPLTSISEHFLRRRAQLMQRFRTDIRDDLFTELGLGLRGDLFQTLENICSSAESRSSTGAAQVQDRTVAWTLDTQGFSPEEITITVSGRRLEVMAAKASGQSDSSGEEEPTPTGFVQSLELPDHIDPTQLTCSQQENGLLRIEAEKQRDPPEERSVPVRFRTSLDFPLSRDHSRETGDGSERPN
ncbi:heat shock protein beta-9 [Hoplias malabaricus]|uniref:heat shock protein beta-9 n=1 Tax=Hoplias malabaricus TaxID=27720 RepID=UPI0034622C12